MDEFFIFICKRLFNNNFISFFIARSYSSLFSSLNMLFISYCFNLKCISEIYSSKRSLKKKNNKKLIRI